MARRVLYLLCILSIGLGLHLDQEEEQNGEVVKNGNRDWRKILKSRKYRFQNDQGKYLAHVHIQNPENPLESVEVSLTDSAADDSTVWKVENKGWALRIQAGERRYLLSPPQSGEVIVASHKTGYSEDWRPRKYVDGKWKITAGSTGFLGACPPGSAASSIVTVCTSKGLSQPSTVWTLTEVQDS